MGSEMCIRDRSDLAHALPLDSLRGRRLKGKGKEIRTRDHVRDNCNKLNARDRRVIRRSAVVGRSAKSIPLLLRNSGGHFTRFKSKNKAKE